MSTKGKGRRAALWRNIKNAKYISVSYTHLTLPTILRV